MAKKITELELVTHAALLLGNDRADVEPEYSRAIAELVNSLQGGSAGDVEATEEMLWAIATEEANDGIDQLVGEAKRTRYERGE